MKSHLQFWTTDIIKIFFLFHHISSCLPQMFSEKIVNKQTHFQFVAQFHELDFCQPLFVRSNLLVNNSRKFEIFILFFIRIYAIRHINNSNKSHDPIVYWTLSCDKLTIQDITFVWKMRVSLIHQTLASRVPTNIDHDFKYVSNKFNPWR